MRDIKGGSSKASRKNRYKINSYSVCMLYLLAPVPKKPCFRPATYPQSQCYKQPFKSAYGDNQLFCFRCYDEEAMYLSCKIILMTLSHTFRSEMQFLL